MEQLPENWKEMTHQDQKVWMIKHYGVFLSPGEWTGIYDYAPDEVKKAYEEWLKADAER